MQRSQLPKAARRDAGRFGIRSLAAILKRVSGLAVLLLASCQVGGEPVRELTDRPWQVTSFAEDADLVGRYVFGLAFESDGSLWIAASGGLRHYDGYTWKNYTTTNSSLPGNFVRCIRLARNGELWVGTDKGVGIFDRQRGTYDQRGLSGPNVRRIFEDPDGTVWCCMDRWLDTTMPAGLAAWSNGRWTHYGISDGLPSDDVISYFRSTNGRQFALTSQGVAERRGERWESIAEQGLPKDTTIWEMVEAADGAMFARSGGPSPAVHILRRDRWETLMEGIQCIFATPRGEVFAASCDPERQNSRLFRWSNTGFVQIASIPDYLSLETVQQTCQAPDGAIWITGRGLLARWQIGGREWTAYEGLPQPQFRDFEGAIWFTNRQQVIRKRGSDFETIPGITGPLWPVGSNGVWTATGSTLMRIDHTNRSTYPEADTGLHQTDGCLADGRGSVWFYGLDGRGDLAFSRFDGQHWSRLLSQDLAAFWIRDAAVDLDGGIWLVLRRKNDRTYQLRVIRGSQIEAPSFPGESPPLANPDLDIDTNGYWLFAFSGLYHMPLDRLQGWRRVQELPYRGFKGYASMGNASVFIYMADDTGRAGVAIYRNNQWKQHYANLGMQTFVQHQAVDGSILFGDRTGFYILNPGQGVELDYVRLPLNATITALLQDRDGDIWIGTRDMVLRYRPSKEPPLTRLSGSQAEIQHDGTIRIGFSGVKRWEPSSMKEACQYSWRMDGSPWTPFSRTAEMTLRGESYRPGPHRFEVRARNTGGKIDMNGAAFDLRIIDMPLERRFWFKCAVAGLILLIGALAFIAFQRARQTARANAKLRLEVERRRQIEAELHQAYGHLEQRVEQRTRQLSDANASLNREMTEHQQAQRALAESELRFRSIVQQSSDVIALLDPRGGINYVSPQLESIAGYHPQDMIGQNAMDFIHEEDRPRVQTTLGQVVQRTNPGIPTEFRFRHIQGHWLYLEALGANLLDHPGIKSILVTIHNVTERKQLEKALRKSEEKFTKAFHSSPDALVLAKIRTGEFIEVNDGFERIFEYTRKEAIGKTALELGMYVHPEDRRQMIQKLMRSGRVQEMEILACRKRGAQFSALISVETTELEGEPSMVTTVRDITEQKRAEAALRVSEDKFSKAFHTSPDSIAINRLADGVYVEVNQSFTALTGYEPADVLGRASSDVGIWSNPEDRIRLVKEVKEKGEVANLEASFRFKDGRTGTGLMSATLIEIDGEPCILSITRDITERKRIEESLKTSLEEKTALLKEVHHRVKNNLQIVISLLNLQAGQTKDRLALNTFLDTQNRVRSMALLHETLYRSGCVAQINLSEYVDDLCAHMFRAFGSQAAHIQLKTRVVGVDLNLDQAVPCGLIISELVSNALKHAFPEGRPGQITIDLSTDGSRQVTLLVADDGVGISSGVDLAATKTLGVHLVRNLAHQLSGTAMLEDRPGTFWRVTFKTEGIRSDSESHL